MQHLDPDTAALVAIGETLDEGSTAHLASCARCTADVEEIRDVVLMARDGGFETLEQPGPAVWEAISRELGLQRMHQPEVPASSAVPSLVERRGTRFSRGGAARWLAAAAVAGVIAGGGMVWAVNALSGTEGDAVAGAVVARTELAALPGYEGSGEATITEVEGAARTLDISLEGQGPGGYREVWLIAPDLQRMYSVGLMDGDEGSFAVPAGVDLAEFSIVDVSDEPYDGDPGHSSVSMVRGTVELPGS